MVTGFKYFPEVNGPTRFAKIRRYAYLQFQAQNHITKYATMRYFENLFGELT